MRWILVTFVALCVFSSALPWLQKFGIGKLPGDLNFKIFGKQISIPIASTILIGTVILLIAKLI